ncbi:MAG: hypothetical protein QOE83_909 [Actinomycetota bacterium]|jgi:hypothetical protein|nr:hypothetical protein [Actinomycetota bacterium]
MIWLVSATSSVAAGLLIAAGVTKLVRPVATARALYAAGLPGSTLIPRAVGAVEIAVGAWVVTAPGILAGAAMAVLYAAFAGFVAFLLIARPEASSCGCAGAKDVPPSVVHLVLNAAAAISGVGVAAVAPPTFARAISSLGFSSVPYAFGLATAAMLAVVAVTDLPPALAAFTRPPRHPVEADQDRHVRAETVLAEVGVGPGHPSLWPDAEPPGA